MQSVRPLTSRAVLVTVAAASLASLALLQPWRSADAAQRRPAALAGPIGITVGQTARLNAFLSPTQPQSRSKLRLTFLDGVTGESLATRDVDLTRGKGAFMDYVDDGLVAGARRCVVGIVSPRDASSGLPTGLRMQVFDTATGMNTESTGLN